MYSSLDPRGSREPGRAVMDIIDGRPWVASRIRNNNLRQHCRKLGVAFRSRREVVQATRPDCRRLLAVITRRSRLLLATHPSSFPLIPMVLRIAAYAGCWLRQPEDWQPDPEQAADGQWRSLLEHLFSAGYPLPRFLAGAWLVPGPFEHVERDWYCHIAAGRSLKDLPGLPCCLSARALHHAMQAPDGLNVRQALRWGQLTALGFGEAMIRQVMASRMASDFSANGVWTALLEKIAGSPWFAPEAFGALADMILHELATEGVTSTDRLMKAPLPELIRRARGLWNRLLQISRQEGAAFLAPAIWRPGVRHALSIFARRSWPLLPGSAGSEVLSLEGRNWQVDQLTTHLQLMKEGDRMGNCVSRYWGKCWSGKAAIFSIRELDPASGKAEPRITIEVDSEDRRIRQIEKRWNRCIYGEKHAVVSQWAARNRVLLT
ncbi:MAG: hypothetical protein JWO82_1528 [Akkermansiaceae bacterium]|nr:hypothetical protein [Akkermansiaceae bacterium]